MRPAVDSTLGDLTSRQTSLNWLLQREAGLCPPCAYATSVAYFSATIRGTRLCHDCEPGRLAVREVIQNRNQARKEAAARAAGEAI